jgi:hypothetical protein
LALEAEHNHETGIIANAIKGQRKAFSWGFRKLLKFCDFI